MTDDDLIMPPPQIVAHAEQGYANANAVLDSMIQEMREQMKAHPELDNHDSLSWYASLIQYKQRVWMIDANPYSREQFRDKIVEILIAAAFRIARMPEPPDPLERLLNNGS